MSWAISFLPPEATVIFDPFCGSGTTGVAALRAGRRFIGVEKSPRWAALARERLTAEEGTTTIEAGRNGQVALF
jgi:DNA modification methylase